MLKMDMWQLPGVYYSSGASHCLKELTPERYLLLQHLNS